MKKILGCVVFCAVGVGIMALLYKLVRMAWGDSAAGITYFSIIFGLMWLFKIVANYQWGQRLGKAEKLVAKSVFQSLNSTLILVYVACILVGSDKLLGMIIHDFMNLPSLTGIAVLYGPIFIGYYFQRKKLAKPDVSTEDGSLNDSSVEPILASPVLELPSSETVIQAADKEAKESPMIEVKHLILGLIMTGVGYVVQANEPSTVNKCGFYLFLICTLSCLLFFAMQRMKKPKRQ